jgi:hypothetical protein
MTGGGLSESERALAQKYYDEPLWLLTQTLAWIASPKIETLAHYEAAYSGRTHARITNQQIAGMVRSNEAILKSLGRAGGAAGTEGLATHNSDEVDELLKALKTGKLKAIGPGNQPLPTEYWYDQSSVDPRTWPKVLFLRDDVLRLWPAVDTVAPAGGLRAGAAPQRSSSEASARNMSPADAQNLLPGFLKERSAKARASGEKFNQIVAQKEAETHFERRIPRPAFREIYNAAGVKRVGGRPRKIPPTEIPPKT